MSFVDKRRRGGESSTLRGAHGLVVQASSTNSSKADDVRGDGVSATVVPVASGEEDAFTLAAVAAAAAAGLFGMDDDADLTMLSTTDDADSSIRSNVNPPDEGLKLRRLVVVVVVGCAPGLPCSLELSLVLVVCVPPFAD